MDKKEMFLQKCVIKGINCSRSLQEYSEKEEANYDSISNSDTSNSIPSQKALSDALVMDYEEVTTKWRMWQKWIGILSSTDDLFCKAVSVLLCTGSHEYVLLMGLLLESTRVRREMVMGNPFPVTYLF